MAKVSFTDEDDAPAELGVEVELKYGSRTPREERIVPVLILNGSMNSMVETPARRGSRYLSGFMR
jgi:hypothetical protein